MPRRVWAAGAAPRAWADTAPARADTEPRRCPGLNTRVIRGAASAPLVLPLPLGIRFCNKEIDQKRPKDRGGEIPAPRVNDLPIAGSDVNELRLSVAY